VSESRTSTLRSYTSDNRISKRNPNRNPNPNPNRTKLEIRLSEV